MKRFLAALIFCVSVGFVQSAHAVAAATAATVAGAANVAGSAVSAVGAQVPVFLGAALGFGNGTGVGNERGLGLRQIEPMIGAWYPGLGFIRVGYGFFNYSETSADDETMDVEHSDLDIELGVHLYGQLYALGGYSRSKDLSDLGDVAWNEWSAGFGTLVSVFGKAMFFAEVTYRWVRDHYDPFIDENVSGSRLQFNIGFATYIY